MIEIESRELADIPFFMLILSGKRYPVTVRNFLSRLYFIQSGV